MLFLADIIGATLGIATSILPFWLLYKWMSKKHEKENDQA